MARIRTIKPEFFTSEDIVSLTPLARLFYVALWCEADKEGRLNWKLGTLKMRYLPGDDAPIQALADELVAAGLVELYEVNGKQYAEIPGFKRHQIINNRESESSLPHRVADAPLTRESGVIAEGKEGKEGKGKEGNARDDAKPPPASRPASKKTQMPPDFAISDRVRQWAAENKHGQLDRHLSAFRISCQAKGYAYADWDAAFMNAIRNNWAKLEATPQQVAASRKPDRFELANLEYEKKYGTPESVKALAEKLTRAEA